MSTSALDDFLLNLSPVDVIALQKRCEQDMEKRRLCASALLSEMFAVLDPDFIRVAASTHDERDGLTRFTYFVRHPRQEADPARCYPMTVSSGQSGVDGKFHIWISGQSTGSPTAEQMRKIEGADKRLRVAYEAFMRARPSPNVPDKGGF